MDIIDTLLKTMAIVFLIFLTIFIFSILVEYVRALWMRHKMKKVFKQQPTEIDIPEEDKKKIEEMLKNIFEKNGIDINDEKNE